MYISILMNLKKVKCIEMNELISVSQAKEIIKDQVILSSKIELPLLESLGFYTAEDILAPMDVPSFDNSAMDGYGFIFSDLEEFSTLKVTKIVPAGISSNEFELGKGEAVRIFTGAKIPSGVDTVIMQELVEVQGEFIQFDFNKVSKGVNIRAKASQTKKGDKIVEEKTFINHAVIGYLAGFGIHKITVHRKLNIGLLYTGNELVEIGNPLSEGEIYNANTYTLHAALSEMNHQLVLINHVEDSPKATSIAVKQALEKVDVLLITGGISVGDYDFVKDALEEHNVEQLFYKIFQKPGKPIYFGKKEDQFVFALPGNPASVFSCYHQYVKPFLKGCFGRENFDENLDYAISISTIQKKNTKQTQFLKANYSQGEVRILGAQESYKMDSVAHANCLVEFPENTSEINIGDEVKIWRI